MYINLTESRTFTAEIPGRTITDLEIESEWNGLTKLVHKTSGLHLIVMREEGLIVDGSKSLIDSLLAPVRTSGFIRVPERKLPNGVIVPEFYVSERKASKGDDGKVVIDAARKPWVSINYHHSRNACKASDMELLTGYQSLSIALDICEQDINWTSGKVGEGSVYQGLHRGAVNCAQDGIFESSHADERRWHQLSTGERIFDFAGNTYEWIFDDVHGDTDGVVREAFSENSPYLKFPSYASREKGMGYRPSSSANWSGHALIRGGFWRSEDYAGVFRLYYGWPVYGSYRVGFRCTK